MEAALLHFVLNVATSFGAQVAQHLAEHPLEGVVAHFAALFARGANGVVAVVGNVEGCGEAMAALLGGVAVALAQPGQVALGAQDAGDDYLVKRHALEVERVEEVAANLGEQVGCARHEIGNAVGHRAVHDDVGTAAHEDEFALALLGLTAVGHGRHAPAAGGYDLHVLHVGEAGFVVVDSADGVGIG